MFLNFKKKKTNKKPNKWTTKRSKGRSTGVIWLQPLNNEA